jgi:hypothetical protein
MHRLNVSSDMIDPDWYQRAAFDGETGDERFKLTDSLREASVPEHTVAYEYDWYAGDRRKDSTDETKIEVKTSQTKTMVAE